MPVNKLRPNWLSAPPAGAFETALIGYSINVLRHI
jgi:hypothetical protein